MEPEGIILSEISKAEKDKYKMTSLTSQKENQEKLNEKNSNRFTETKNGLTVIKGKETVVDSWEWRNMHITISMCYVEGVHKEGCKREKTSRDSTLSYYVHGQRLQWGIWGHLVDGGSLVNYMLLM